jgi:DNA-binding transcriptional ArsR family regulator
MWSNGALSISGSEKGPISMSGKAATAWNTEKRAEILAEAFAEEYHRYQYALVEFVVAHLTDLSRSFNGDLQQAVILAVIGQVRLHVRKAVAESGGTPPADEDVSITASRLSDVTGIPRETVRRKLKLLQDRGWIERRRDGAWFLVTDRGGSDAPARRHFAEQDKRTRRLVADLFVELEKLARRRGG